VGSGNPSIVYRPDKSILAGNILEALLFAHNSPDFMVLFDDVKDFVSMPLQPLPSFQTADGKDYKKEKKHAIVDGYGVRIGAAEDEGPMEKKEREDQSTAFVCFCPEVIPDHSCLGAITQEKIETKKKESGMSRPEKEPPGESSVDSREKKTVSQERRQSHEPEFFVDLIA